MTAAYTPAQYDAYVQADVKLKSTGVASLTDTDIAALDAYTHNAADLRQQRTAAQVGPSTVALFEYLKTSSDYARWKDVWALLNVFVETIRDQNGKVKALEAAVADLGAGNAARTKGLGTGGVSWGGPHQPGGSYTAGTLVQKNGVWIALKDTNGTPGEDFASWKLVIPRKLAPRD